MSQGKGVTADLAQASAVMESIELYHAEHVEPARPGRVVPRGAAAPRGPGSPRPAAGSLLARPTPPTRPIAWIRGTDLASGEPLLVPHARVNMHWSRSHPDDGLLFVTSSGLASGNHRSEALCHAMFEVIERDCERRWERMSPAAQRSRELDADTVDPPVLRGLLDQFAGAGVSVRMWDMTSEVGIPAFGCSIDEAGPLGRTGPTTGSAAISRRRSRCRAQ